MGTVINFAALAAAALVAISSAHAAPVEDSIRAQVQPALPAGTDVAKVFMPASLAKLDVDPADVIVEMPRELRAGRKSVKVTVVGQRAMYVPLSIAVMADVAIAERKLVVGKTITEADVRIETIAIDGDTPAPASLVIGSRIVKPVAAGKTVGEKDIALPPPLPRGTQVTVEMRRGQVRVKGQGTLSLVARVGETATVRLEQNGVTLRGTLVAPATVVVGGI